MKADCNNGDYYEITVTDKITGEENVFAVTSNKNDYEVLAQHYDNVQLMGQDSCSSNSNSSNSDVQDQSSK